MRLLWITLFLLASLKLQAQQVEVSSIESHFAEIMATENFRNYRHVEALNTVAHYIKNELERYADSTYYQPYEVNGTEYKNVVAVFGNEHDETIVVGAHYDVCGDQDGADDNASGVIGILELAKLLQGETLAYRIELVAFTLEEPPFFRTEHMGSYQHAKSLFESNRKVYGMIALDMIGYFDDTKKSQHFPVGIMSWIYGNKGDFILLANKWGKGAFARKFSRKFKRQDAIKVARLTGPKSIEGLDWSDHLNYWHFGYSASMITDTAANRNKNYHRKSDTIDTIDMDKMAKVIEGIFSALKELE